jgi:hypothetical protein
LEVDDLLFLHSSVKILRRRAVGYNGNSFPSQAGRSFCSLSRAGAHSERESALSALLFLKTSRRKNFWWLNFASEGCYTAGCLFLHWPLSLTMRHRFLSVTRPRTHGNYFRAQRRFSVFAQTDSQCAALSVLCLPKRRANVFWQGT